MSEFSSSSPSPPIPRSLTPPGIPRETAHLCDCPFSRDMIELQKTGIAMPVYHYGFLIDSDLWQHCKPLKAQSNKDTIMNYLLYSASASTSTSKSNGPIPSTSARMPDFQPSELRALPQAVTKLALIDSFAKDECPILDLDVTPVGQSVLVLSYFSNTYPSYAMRPTQEEMDLLERVLDQRPRWWRAYSMGG